LGRGPRQGGRGGGTARDLRRDPAPHGGVPLSPRGLGPAGATSPVAAPLASDTARSTAASGPVRFTSWPSGRLTHELVAVEGGAEYLGSRCGARPEASHDPAWPAGGDPP